MLLHTWYDDTSEEAILLKSYSEACVQWGIMEEFLPAPVEFPSHYVQNHLT